MERRLDKLMVGKRHDWHTQKKRMNVMEGCEAGEGTESQMCSLKREQQGEFLQPPLPSRGWN